MTRVLKCDPTAITFLPGLDEPIVNCTESLNALKKASRHLTKDLQPVVFPTETVYGLGALALNASAANRIFSTKGRPPDNPLIVHVSSFAMLHTLLPKDYAPSRAYQILMETFWPGPLTLLFPRDSDQIPSIITANQNTVAIRMPSHPVARALIAIANAPLAAPSANTSGKPSPTRADHVLNDLDGKVDIILDGGPCEVGLESTVIDGLHEDGKLRILRPGGVTVEEIERVLQQEFPDRPPPVLVHRRDYRDAALENAPTTPGMKYRHYAPSVPVTMLFTKSQPPKGENSMTIPNFLKSLTSNPSHPSRPVKYGVLAPADSPLWGHLGSCNEIEWHWYRLGRLDQPSVTAQRLFDGLLTLEQENVDHILIEEVQEDKEGLAVMNRARKAAGGFLWLDPVMPDSDT